MERVTYDAWRAALAAEEPVEALRAEAQNRLAAGETRERLKTELQALVHAVRFEAQASRRRSDEDEEPILDVLDMLSGWSRPGTAL
jgi:hypothetical protein